VARHLHRLTATAIANLRAKGMHPDGGGLYMRLTANGTKSWIFRYTTAGKTHDMGLGAYPTVTLGKARELAIQCRRQRQDGRDPIEARVNERTAATFEGLQATTFKACAEQLISSHEIGWRNAKHRQEWRRTLSTYVYPSFGNVPVSQVTTEHFLSALQPIWSTKTETASRMRGRIEAVLTLAKVSQRGRLTMNDSNPASSLRSRRRASRKVLSCGPRPYVALNGAPGRQERRAVIELGDQQVLVLGRPLCSGHIANGGCGATLVASIKPNACQAKHQDCETSQSYRNRHHIGRQS